MRSVVPRFLRRPRRLPWPLLQPRPRVPLVIGEVAQLVLGRPARSFPPAHPSRHRIALREFSSTSASPSLLYQDSGAAPAPIIHRNLHYFLFRDKIANRISQLWFGSWLFLDQARQGVAFEIVEIGQLLLFAAHQTTRTGVKHSSQGNDQRRFTECKCFFEACMSCPLSPRSGKFNGVKYSA